MTTFIRAHGECNRRQRMITSPRDLIPPLVYPAVRVCRTPAFVFSIGMRLITIRYFDLIYLDERSKTGNDDYLKKKISFRSREHPVTFLKKTTNG